jgi:hypothetical protein
LATAASRAARIPNRTAFGIGVAAYTRRVVAIGFGDLNGPSDAVIAMAGFRN